MGRPRKDIVEEPVQQRRHRRPTTTEGQENYLMNLANKLAEKQLVEGTASSQVITHFLKLSTVREEIERDKLRNEVRLLQARVEMLQANANTEEFNREVIAALTGYMPEKTDEPYG